MADTQTGKFESGDESTREAGRKGGRRSHGGGNQ